MKITAWHVYTPHDLKNLVFSFKESGDETAALTRALYVARRRNKDAKGRKIVNVLSLGATLVEVSTGKVLTLDGQKQRAPIGTLQDQSALPFSQPEQSSLF